MKGRFWGQVLVRGSSINFGGQDHPYPDSVPECGNEEIGRIGLIHDRDGHAHWKTLEPDSPLDSQYTDPTDQQVGHLTPNEEVVHLCQQELPVNPDHYGLFWVMQQNPFSAYRNNENPATARSVMEARRDLQSALPEDVARCEPTDQDSERIISWEEGLSGLYREILLSRFDPFVMADAPFVANRLVMEVSLYDINEDQETALQDTVAFALQNGIPEDELLDLSSELYSTWDNTDQFIYKLATIISLRVARQLHMANLENGGIYQDFNEFAQSIEDAIIDRGIGVHIMTVSDRVRSPTAVAFYSHKSDNLTFKPLDKNVFIPALFGTLLHECYHAYQDLQARPLTILETEEPAYEITAKADFLLSWSLFMEHDSGMEYYIEQRRQLEIFKSQVVGQRNACLGTPASAILFMREIMSERSWWYKAWNTAIRFELMGFYDLQTEGLFHENYAISNYNSVTQRLNSKWFVNIGRDYNLGRLDGTEMTLEEANSRLKELRNGIYINDAGTKDRYEAVLRYLDEAARLTNIFYFANRDLWTEFKGEEVDFMFISDISEALLYQSYDFNGITPQFRP